MDFGWPLADLQQPQPTLWIGPEFGPDAWTPGERIEIRVPK